MLFCKVLPLAALRSINRASAVHLPSGHFHMPSLRASLMGFCAQRGVDHDGNCEQDNGNGKIKELHSCSHYLMFLITTRPIIQEPRVAISPPMNWFGFNPEEMRYGMIREAKHTSPIVIRTSAMNLSCGSEIISFQIKPGKEWCQAYVSVHWSWQSIIFLLSSLYGHHLVRTRVFQNTVG